MNEITADFEILRELPSNDRVLELNIVEIFTAELGRFKRIIAGMGLNTADCEDILQDVSVRALKNPPVCRTRREAIRWLIRVTVNQCLSEHRRRKRFKKHADQILKRTTKNQTNSAEKKAIAAEELEIVRLSLGKLSDDLLGPVVLRYFCDMDSKEISEILKQNQSTIRDRLRVARMELAKGLRKRGVER